MLAGETIEGFFCEGLYLLPVTETEIRGGFPGPGPGRLQTRTQEVSVNLTSFRVIISFAGSPRPRIDIARPMLAAVTRGRDTAAGTVYADVATKHVWAFRLAALSEAALTPLFRALDRAARAVGAGRGGGCGGPAAWFAFDHFAARRAANATASAAAASLVAVGDAAPGDAATSAAALPALASQASDPGWGIFSAARELERQARLDACAERGPGSNLLPWFHVVTLPEATFPTYPPEVVVPRRATVELLASVGRFRQNARVPIVSWTHLCSGGSIARCSQPRVGGAGRRSADDEALCSYLNQSLHAGVAESEFAPVTPSVPAAPSLPVSPLPATAGSSGGSGALPPPPPLFAASSAFFDEPQRSGGGTGANSAPPSIGGASSAASPVLQRLTALQGFARDAFGVGRSSAATTSPAPPPAVAHHRDPSTHQRPPSLVDPLSAAPSPSASSDALFSLGASANGPPPCPPAALAAAATPVAAAPTAAVQQCEGRKLHFVDCRSWAAATANMAGGGGAERAERYDRAELHFLDLPNIHGVRATFEKLARVVQESQGWTHGTEPTSRTPARDFLTRVEATGWVGMVQKLLWGAGKVADHVAKGDTCLVHCTDGWDRTSQIVSLAMLLSDAYYRTVEGFCVLVEKEWLRAGHRFADRCGHNAGEGSSDGSQGPAVGGGGAGAADECIAGGEEDDGAACVTGVDATGRAGSPVSSPVAQTASHHDIKPVASPVFVQWVDCVYQLLRMFPTEFEFTPHFLLLLTDAVYSCRFGTFLLNSHRARWRGGGGGVVSRTASFWSEVELLVAREGGLRGTAGAVAVPTSVVPASERVLNPFFDRRRFLSERPTQRRLAPSAHGRRYVFWTGAYCRYDADVVDSGLTGLEPDCLTPLVESFLSHLAALAPSVGNDNSGSDVDEGEVALEGTGVARRATAAVAPLAALAVAGRLLWEPRVAVPRCTVAESSAWVVVGTGALDSPVPVPLAVSGQASPPGLVLSGGGGGGAPHSNFIPRSDAKECELCAAPFTLFQRRHTCRACCRAVCASCGGHFEMLRRDEIALFDDRDATGALRVCKLCCRA